MTDEIGVGGPEEEGRRKLRLPKLKREKDTGSDKDGKRKRTRKTRGVVTPAGDAEPAPPLENKEPSRFAAETEDLRGCWRTFFLAFIALVVILAGIAAYRVLFVTQPWKSSTERAADVQAEILAGLPASMPDVYGLSVVDGLYALNQAGYEDITLFSTEHHAFRAGTRDFTYNPGLPVMLTRPKPGEPSSLTVSVWFGARPETPDGVELDSFWFPHTQTIEDHGSFGCVQNCHTPEPFCTSCHESRLRSSDSPFLTDPESAPELATAVAAAIDVEVTHISATYQGIGWYRIDVLLEEPGDLGDIADSAREAAVAAFPAAYNVETEAEVIVLRWVDAGTLDSIVEIGLERPTYESLTWMGIEPSDIPWVVDRYAVSSGQE